MTYIRRKITDKIAEAHAYFPVIMLTGPRQSGKTTLCRHLYPDYKFVNLELITMRRRAKDDPEGFIDSLGQKAIIDEAHNVPEILSVIQARVDENKDLRYILTGSSNFALIRDVGQSLAGRVAVFTLLPFSINELGREYLSNGTNYIEYHGFYPGVVADGQPIDLFYESYITTYIERDIRDLLKVSNLDKFDRFLRLCAGRVSGEFNASSLATEVGVSSTTIAEWLSILNASYITFTLSPYFKNIGKRLTKTPKLYFYDTGLMTHLLGIEAADQLNTHPLRGAIFENMVVAEMMKTAYNAARRPNYYFYRENSGREVDLVKDQSSTLDLYEIKAGSTYRKTFIENMQYLKELMVDKICNSTLIYDGDTIAPAIYNFRDYFCPDSTKE
ncbi:MAG: ATP-binding protein [Muribaculum sp.]|nr:ATP-binding protein [Muribaculum sp.]